MGFSNVYCADGLNNTLVSQVCVLETAQAIRIVDRTYIPRTRDIIAFALPSIWNVPPQIYHGLLIYQLHFFTQMSPSQ